MRLLPIRVMKISRRVAATVESVSSSTKAPTSIPSRPCAMAPKLLQFARAPRRSRPQKAPDPLLAQATSKPLFPQAILGAPLPPNNPEPAQSVEAKLDLSLFRELYRSRDGRLVFFEHCATGHLAAVDASKLV